ncbi:MAG TPA: tetratricopeptide repeat protein, partial [Polyangia bacterium]
MAAVAVAGVCAAVATPAQAQEEGVAKVRELNKKAVDAYENLDLEESRKFLMQALEVSATEGLNRHTIKATTHLNLGVVLVGGLKQRDAGIKQFRRALEIDPAIKVPKRLNNPEIQSAFEAATKPEGTGTEPPRGTQPPPVATTPPDNGGAANLTVTHEAISEASGGEAIDIRAQVQGTTRFEKVVLAYRAEGVSDFLARDMERDAEGNYTASIPDTAA